MNKTVKRCCFCNKEFSILSPLFWCEDCNEKLSDMISVYQPVTMKISISDKDEIRRVLSEAYYKQMLGEYINGTEEN